MSNCLITKTGKQIDCTGAAHYIICCQQLKISVETFLKRRGGVRIKVCWPDTETIAIEYYYKLTKQQIRAIRKILRMDNYYAVILESELITRCRPIRSFDFDGSLLPKRNINVTQGKQ